MPWRCLDDQEGLTAFWRSGLTAPVAEVAVDGQGLLQVPAAAG
jgi:hypothetical protein